MDAATRAAALREAAVQAAGCIRCSLAAGRTQVVFGEGNPDAELALVGEAPGFHEDRDGLPFAGRAARAARAAARRGRDRARRRLPRDRAQVPARRATATRCPEETAACEPYLYRQLELVRPRVVASLGSFATALLSGRALGITRVHGQEQQVTLGGRSVILYPLYHPAAALYTPSMLAVLEQDVARPARAALGRDRRHRRAPAAARAEPAHDDARSRQPVQLGLF